MSLFEARTYDGELGGTARTTQSHARSNGYDAAVVCRCVAHVIVYLLI
jgi:hypothetical protein